MECGTALEGISRAFREQEETVVRQDSRRTFRVEHVRRRRCLGGPRGIKDEDGEVVDEDSCGGIWGQEYIKEVAEETLDRWRKEYGEKTAGAGGAK